MRSKERLILESGSPGTFGGRRKSENRTECWSRKNKVCNRWDKKTEENERTPPVEKLPLKRKQLILL